jgi:hypothetical protein
MSDCRNQEASVFLAYETALVSALRDLGRAVHEVCVADVRDLEHLDPDRVEEIRGWRRAR